MIDADYVSNRNKYIVVIASRTATRQSIKCTKIATRLLRHYIPRNDDAF